MCCSTGRPCSLDSNQVLAFSHVSVQATRWAPFSPAVSARNSFNSRTVRFGSRPINVHCTLFPEKVFVDLWRMARRLLRNGFTLMALALLVVTGFSRMVGRQMGSGAGWIVFAMLAGALLTRIAMGWLAHGRLGKQVNWAGIALDDRKYREALQGADDAIAMARKWKFTPDDLVAMAFVIRAEALRKTGNNQEALEASARAFACMCGVEKARTQLTIFDQLGSLLLDTGHARRAIPILEAAVGLGHRASAKPLATAGRLERAGMASFRVGVHANAAAAFGKAIDLMTKERGADALELASPYI